MSERLDDTGEATQFRPDRLTEIRAKLEAKLAEDSVLSSPTIQYVFSEVGQAFLRLDPRELQLALRLTAETWREAGSAFAEALPGIYVYQGATRADPQLQGTLAHAPKKHN